MQKRKLSQSAGKTMSRRGFMGGAAGALAGFMIVPRHVLGGPGQLAPSDKVNVASIGAGGQAEANIPNCAKVANIVAMCDVDEVNAALMYKQFPDVPKYRDFRVMLDKQHKDIDAVLVITPDHTHALATMAALKAGKHVYTQKPLTRTIYEARKLTEAAREAKVVTQMGNQGHSGEGTRLLTEWIMDGAIGAVREVHCWTDRPGYHWAQGVARPKESMTPPATLDWELWLGSAPSRPFNSCYLPSTWRGWWDFGCGALGDMGCHIMDQPFEILKLGYPTSVEASYTVTAKGDLCAEIERETAPIASAVRYEFPARGDMPAVSLMWYDGGIKPFRPGELEPDRTWPDNGMLFVGEKASLLAECYGESPRIIPEKKMREYKRPAKTLARIPGGMGGHEEEWLRAIRENRPANSNFDYAGPLTEVVLLGNLAIRCGGKKLLWDGPNMKCTNVAEANELIKPHYREGWSL